MPPFPIIDTHVHLWNPRHFRMRWLDGNELLERAYLPDDFHAHTAGVDLESIVFVETAVEPAYALLEARWVDELAGSEPLIAGIVAHAPLEDGVAVRSYLDALAAIGARVKGVRRLIQDEADPRFALRPEFEQGVRMLSEYGWSFDLCIRHHQLPAAIELVRRVPETSFVLDHLGKPPIAEGRLDPWREQLAELAGLPNVVCKVSGAVTEADHQSWDADDLRPFVAHALDVFGPQRVMFGGDWPVVLMASPYRRWVETLDQLTAGLAPAEQQALWRDNARRVYQLPITN